MSREKLAVTSEELYYIIKSWYPAYDFNEKNYCVIFKINGKILDLIVAKLHEAEGEGYELLVSDRFSNRWGCIWADDRSFSEMVDIAKEMEEFIDQFPPEAAIEEILEKSDKEFIRYDWTDADC